LIIGGEFAGIAAARGLKVEIVKTGSRSLSLAILPPLLHESVY
jgi:pyruvate/2-oxoglutarate dehydrogenase complex dihydrolipoamide dehydrogenase (E3) component